MLTYTTISFRSAFCFFYCTSHTAMFVSVSILKRKIYYQTSSFSSKLSVPHEILINFIEPYSFMEGILRE
jgi:hypothetical protein